MRRTLAWLLVGFAAGWLCGTVALAAAGAQGADVAAAIDSAAATYGLSPRFLYCLAGRESTFRPGVTSPWGDRGLYQWKSPTWAAHAPRYGFGGYSPYHAWAAAHVTAGTIAHQSLLATNRMWPPSRWCGSPWW